MLISVEYIHHPGTNLKILAVPIQTVYGGLLCSHADSDFSDIFDELGC